MRYEVQYLDGLGAWRRWALLGTRAGAERSAERCRKFFAPYAEEASVRVREVSA